MFAVGISTTLSLTLMLHNVYRSTAVIVIDPPQVSSGYVTDAGKPRDSLSVADQLEALEYRAFNQERREELIRKYGLYGYGPGKPIEPRVALMKSKIDLVVPQDTIVYESARPGNRAPDVLNISYEYDDPVIAQSVTQELADSYVDEGYRERIERAHDATRFLSSQAGEARSRLDAKDSEIKELERQYEGSLPEELGPNLAELARLQDQLSMIDQQMLTERVAPRTSEAGVATSPQQELTMLQLRLNQLHLEYSDEYPDVVQLKQEIADLKGRIDSEAAGAASAPASGSEVSLGQSRLERESEIDAAKIEALKSRIAITPIHGQELAALQHDYDSLAAEYHGLFNKAITAQLDENLEKRHQDERLRVLQPASLPRQPIRPHRLTTGIVGLFLSALAAVALPFGLYFTDTSFKDIEELQNELSIPVIAAIPIIPMPAERRLAVTRAIVASSVGILVTTGAIWAYTHNVF